MRQISSIPFLQSIERRLGQVRLFLREGSPLVQARALILLAVGWLLSPLCWWNDLVINLPLAWLVGRLASIYHEEWFTAGVLIGYWFTNLIGIVLMQYGALDIFRDEDKPRNPRQELLSGLVTSTAYSVVVFVLLKTGLVPVGLPALT